MTLLCLSAELCAQNKTHLFQVGCVQRVFFAVFIPVPQAHTHTKLSAETHQVLTKVVL